MTVRKRRDRGFWEYDFHLDGKRYRVGGFATKHEAETAEADERSKLQSGMAIDKNTVTVAEYLTSWLQSKEPPELVPSTWQRYDELFRLYIVPTIGKVLLRKLSPVHVRQVLDIVKIRGRSARTAQQVYAVLHAALNDAVDLRLVPRNEAAAIKKPRAERPELYVPNVEETRQLLERAESTPFALVYWLAALTGCREGEILGLRWAKVDMRAGSAEISTSLRRISKKTAERLGIEPGLRLQDTKTHRTRTVSLSGPAIGLLTEQSRRQQRNREKWGDDYADNDLVFADEMGRPFDGTRVGKAWKNQVAKAACLHSLPESQRARHVHAGCLGTVRVHDLRHAYVTSLLKKGFSAKVVQANVGHQSAAFTLDRYAHAPTPDQEEAAEAMAEMLRRK
jgi:integrase